MCLQKLDDFPINTNVGFKAFIKDSYGQLECRFPIKFGLPDNARNDGPYPIKKWIEDVQPFFKPLQINGVYEQGFHICKLYQSTLIYNESTVFKNVVICKVLFKDIVATGYEYKDGCHPIIVARKMFIVGEVNV